MVKVLLLVVFLVATAASAFTPSTPEVLCGTATIVDPDKFVIRNLPNFIGGANHWWGPKSNQTVAPVSWIDTCAKRLEACQAPSGNDTDATCVCNMWTCLNPPRGATPKVRPLCQWSRAYLLQYYCQIARDMSLTCGDTIPASCPAPPPTGMTFDDIATSPLPDETSAPVPNGYGGLNWEKVRIHRGTVQTVYYSGFSTGMISPEYVAYFNDGVLVGIAPYISALRPNLTFTLNSGYFTREFPIASDGPFTIKALDSNNVTIGTYTMGLELEVDPLFVDFTNPSRGSLNGTFQNIYALTASGVFFSIVMDNVDVTLNYDPSQFPVQRELEQQPGEGVPSRRLARRP